ncbi:interaptin-like isoform X2 [Dreissena polymorpha]|uniref:interaptin-like isoform X2 n=1 Tax=Dreissena polymorpha TaxID=45954 RepID=UPI002263D84B|nr:interaptin-like isoform X2 [Dreissena polymorpha]
MRPIYPSMRSSIAVSECADPCQHNTGGKKRTPEQDPGHRPQKEHEGETVQLRETLKEQNRANAELTNNVSHLKDKIGTLQKCIDGLKKETDKRKSEVDPEGDESQDMTIDGEHLQRHQIRRDHQSIKRKGKLNAEKTRKKEVKKRHDEPVPSKKFFDIERNTNLGRRNVKTRGIQTSTCAFDEHRQLQIEFQKVLKRKEECEHHMSKRAKQYSTLQEKKLFFEQKCLKLTDEISSNYRRYEDEKLELQRKCTELTSLVQLLKRLTSQADEKTALFRTKVDELQQKLDSKRNELQQLNEDLQNKAKILEQEKSKSALQKAKLLEENIVIEKQSKKWKNEADDFRRKYQDIMEPLEAVFTDPKGILEMSLHLMQISELLSRYKNEDHSLAKTETE